MERELMKYKSENLFYEGRYLRTRSGKLLFGPAGKRLFVDYLDKMPGFCGRIDFIHKINLTEIFKVVTDINIRIEEAEAIWYPDHLHMQYKDGNVTFCEDKFITWDDMAVSCQHWENNSAKDITLAVKVEPEQCQIEKNPGRYSVCTPLTQHGYRVFYSVGWSGFDELGFMCLKPGEQADFAIASAFGNLEMETEEEVNHLLQKYLEAGGFYLEKHKKQYGEFYEKVPVFSCSDELLNRVWSYRWYILKNTYAEPGYGNFHHGVMFEGRSHKMGKTPFVSEGWEFTKLIPLSTPLHLTDLKWSNLDNMGKELILSLLDSQGEDGLFRVMMTDEFGNAYANYAVWAIYKFILHNKEIKFAGKILASLKLYISAHERMFTQGEDSLQIERIHQLTGKEYQPSYWYFFDYPEDYKNPETYSWLKRVDRSIYHYLNLKGMAGLCSLCKDEEAVLYLEKAEHLQSEIQDKMWSEESHFYYDLHCATEEKALVKNIVGFYPLWADICKENQLDILNYLTDESGFETDADYPSVARDCPAYSASGGWMKQYIKGRDGCVWCGPSWPYTNGIMVDMLGIQTKKLNHTLDSLFEDRLFRYAREHFRDYDMGRPYLVEHYNPETGEPLSDEVDYNHSFFIQLIMEHVLGITVTEEGILFDPVDVGLSWFSCDQIIIQGHIIMVEYKRGKYFRIFIDGNLVTERGDLGKTGVFLW